MFSRRSLFRILGLGAAAAVCPTTIEKAVAITKRVPSQITIVLPAASMGQTIFIIGDERTVIVPNDHETIASALADIDAEQAAKEREG